ncbi:hypothetical protein Tco_1343120 [Tanacetum coccineum]
MRRDDQRLPLRNSSSRKKAGCAAVCQRWTSSMDDRAQPAIGRNEVRGVNEVEAGIRRCSYEKYTAALQALKDLKYPLVDELEQLKYALIDCIMASLHLESDIGEDAPRRNPWAVRKEILLEDAIAANISRAEKKKKSRVVCRTHRVGSAHHARSDGVPVYVPVVPQGHQIALMDASTQTDLDKDNSPRRLTRASSVPLF